MTHAGVRIGVPSRLVLSVRAYEPGLRTITLWAVQEGGTLGERVFAFSTAAGPRLVRASEASVAWLASGVACPITPYLRRFMTLSHIVGLADLGGALTWLVDPHRIHSDGITAASFAA